MHSNKYDFDYGQRRPQSSRGSRPWDEDDRREEWKAPPKSSIREAYEKYMRDGHNAGDRPSTNDYGEPNARAYDSDTDWRNKRTSRYSHEPKDSYRQSPENYSQRNKDFKHTVSEGLGRRRTPEESRYSQPQDEFHYKEYKKESHYRPATEFYKDRDSRERSRSPQRTRPREDFMKSYSPPRQRSGSFSRDHEDQNRTRFSLNGSSRLREQSHRRLSPPPPPPPPAAVGEKKMSKGFQRFLDVLNMGVNMDTLTKIVTQGSPDVKSSSSPHMDCSWTEPSQRQNPQHWPQTETRLQRDRPLYSSNGKNMSEGTSLESRPYEKKCLSPTIKAPSSDDEHKRQVQDVLQAIGIKLEFEELGQMSSRIQERLYGKRQPEIAPPHNQMENEDREKRRQAYAPKRHSRSSSDSSSSDSCQNYKQSHSYSSQWKERDLSYQTDTRGTQQSALKYPTQVIPPALQQTPNRQPIPPPVLPPPSPVANCPPSPYLPPNLPFAMPNMLMPPPIQTHPYLPNLLMPPRNVFPPIGPPSAPVQPQQPNKNRNPPKRHRYLQQVPTKK